ncbi:integrase, partial [Methylobacterium radiotolerans]
MAEIKPVFALSSYRTKESRIRKYLSPKFDGMPMSDIHPAHERQQVKQRNLEALEERKRVRKARSPRWRRRSLAEIKPVFALSSYRTKESRIRKYLSPKFDGMP